MPREVEFHLHGVEKILLKMVEVHLERVGFYPVRAKAVQISVELLGKSLQLLRRSVPRIAAGMGEQRPYALNAAELTLIRQGLPVIEKNHGRFAHRKILFP